jgi:hypothetical protein
MAIETKELMALRSMAWERAKGELESIKHTYYESMETLELYEKILSDFIKRVEDDGFVD